MVGPTSATGVRLDAVTCGTTTRCVAVGFYNDRFSDTLPFSETWNGSGWTLVAMALPDPIDESVSAYVYGLSCPSASYCVAVGQHSPSFSNPLQSLVETFNGTTWSVTDGTLAPGPGILNAVSCSSPTSCLAVGRVANGSSLAEAWNGTTWSLTTPTGTDPSASDLLGVSCPGSAPCLAAGFTGNSLLAATFSAVTWTGTVPTNPAGASESFVGTSCVSATFCVAVGNVVASNGNQSRLAELWNGTTWQLQHA